MYKHLKDIRIKAKKKKLFSGEMFMEVFVQKRVQVLKKIFVWKRNLELF